MDCVEERILKGEPQCRLRLGRLLVTLYAPTAGDGQASAVVRQTSYPGPGSFAEEIHVLTMKRVGTRREVAAVRLLAAS